MAKRRGGSLPRRKRCLLQGCRRMRFGSKYCLIHSSIAASGGLDGKLMDPEDETPEEDPCHEAAITLLAGKLPPGW